MSQKKDTPVITLVLLAALSAAPVTVSSLTTHPLFAQTPSASPSFPLPKVVPSGSKIRIDGSDSMEVINQFLKQRYETAYAGTTVDLSASGTQTALQALLDGTIDLAAIGRALTPEEKAKGLVQVPISREKIAIVVSANNPFKGNLSDDQFAKIFRGEITNWSQVGGAPGAIRVIDRPETSDTRQAFRNYPVFKKARFGAGKTAVQLGQDSTAAMIKQLGRDGIGYAIYSQVSNLKTVRIVAMHKTLPSDARYPFSQPRVYVYKTTPTPVAKDFLGYATAPVGQQVVETAKVAEATAVAAGQDPVTAVASPTATSSPLTGNLSATSPDGKTIASAKSDGTVQLTDAQGNPIGQALKATGAAVSSVVFSPDGKTLAAGYANGNVQLADTQGTPLSNPFKVSDAAVTGLAFSPDGKSVTIPGKGGTPLAWDLQGTPIAQTTSGQTTTPAAGSADPAKGKGFPWWLLLPLALLGLLLWWWSRKGRSSTEPAIAPTDPPATLPDSSAPVASPLLEGERPEVIAETDVTLSSASGLMGELTLAEGVLPDSTAAMAGEAALADAEAADTPTVAEPAEVASYKPADDLGDVEVSPDLIVGTDPARAASEVAAGKALAESGHYEEALASFDRAIEVDPYSTEAWVYQGEALTRLGDPATALNSYDRAIELFTQPVPTLVAGAALAGGAALAAKAWAGRGNALVNLDRPEDALASFDQAVALNPDAAEAWSSRGNVLMRLGNPTEAKASFDRVAELHPAAPPLPDPWNTDAATSAVLAGGVGTAAFASLADNGTQTGIEATKYNVGQVDRTGGDLASVDEGLPDLPEGYGESRIVLMPRDPQWAYAYWDIPNEHKEEVRRQGGSRLALRFYDVTDVDLNDQNPHSLQQYDCEEIAHSWYLPVPVSDRDYVVEIGYVGNSGQWLLLARSAPVRIPPVYPSDWFEDQFVTVSWDEDLQGKTVHSLTTPSQQPTPGGTAIYDEIFEQAQSVESLRIAGSLFGSMQQVAGSIQQQPIESISSYVFPSGVGLWAVPTLSGLTASGIGFSASAPPIRPRKFWLVADAELIVYGATEPDATVTIAGRPIQLSPDGTFRFQTSFQDGVIDYPILAVAADGEQNRAIHMTFTRETPERRTNTKDEAVDEWLT